MITKMSITEYVQYREEKGNSITSQGIAKAIREKREIPGVEKCEMYGRTYVLYVNLNLLDKYLVSINKPLKLQRKIK